MVVNVEEGIIWYESDFVAENIDDPLPFIDKLRAVQKNILIISLPYLWPASKAPLEHKNYPIDMEKIHRWFGEESLEDSVVTERNGTRRWVGVYAKFACPAPHSNQ